MKQILKSKLKSIISTEIENDEMSEKISEKIVNDGWVKVNFEIGKTYYYKKNNSEICPVIVDKIEFLVDKIRIRARYFVKEIIYFDNEDYNKKVFEKVEDITMKPQKGQVNQKQTDCCQDIIYSDGKWW